MTGALGSRVRPPRLAPGDPVALIAPAGPVPREAFEVGRALLAERYALRFDESGLFTRTGYLAGSDERRLDELGAALLDRHVRAIVCARGGYGITRLLDKLPPDLLRLDPKPLVGFSDITALHAACLRAGLVSVHAPVVTQLGKLDEPAATAAQLILRLESPEPQAPWTGLSVLARGTATGLAVGGNLEVLSRLLGTPWLPPLDGAVLFLEEVAERGYRLDRLLTHLGAAGVFSRVGAVVLGDFVDCDAPDGSTTAADILRERLAHLPIPVVAGGPFGHGRRNRPFAHGALCRVEARGDADGGIDASGGTVEFLEGAVA